MITLAILCLTYTFYLYYKGYKKCKQKEIKFNLSNFIDSISFGEFVAAFWLTAIIGGCIFAGILILIIKYLP